jgi:hypothetical protein
VPDLRFCREIDPLGRDEFIYNRYAFVNVTLGGSQRFVPLSPVMYSIDVLPTDPRLLARGTHFAVFPVQMAELTGGMRLRLSFPKNRIWIYELPRGAAVARPLGDWLDSSSQGLRAAVQHAR